MTHRLVLLGLLAAACLPAADALAFCTTRERIQLRNEGVPQMEIDRLCGGATQQRAPSMPPQQQQMPRPRFATLCMTTAGPCPMAVAMPVGSACACYTPGAPSRGRPVGIPMADIFLSYGHADRARAEVIATALTARFSVWWDKDLDAACTWRKELEEQIDAARCVLVLWTETSRDKDFVRSKRAAPPSAGRCCRSAWMATMCPSVSPNPSGSICGPGTGRG
jgi:hypothetical protein